MAKFNVILPTELIKEFGKVEKNSEKMVEEMTRAGAETVILNVKVNMTKSFKDTSELEKYLRLSRTYKTPSDDGINTKVILSGYMKNKNGQEVPVPLVAMAREYGTSRGEAKKPFFRKSFKKNEIEVAMQKIQDKYLPKE